MNWKQATAELERGLAVRRPHWVTSLHLHEDQIEWRGLTETLLRSCNYGIDADAGYDPAACDIEADDWEIAA